MKYSKREPNICNLDEVMLGMYDEQISGKTMGIPPFYSGFGNIDMVQKIRVVDQLSRARNIRHLFN